MYSNQFQWKYFFENVMNNLQFRYLYQNNYSCYYNDFLLMTLRHCCRFLLFKSYNSLTYSTRKIEPKNGELITVHSFSLVITESSPVIRLARGKNDFSSKIHFTAFFRRIIALGTVRAVSTSSLICQVIKRKVIRRYFHRLNNLSLRFNVAFGVNISDMWNISPMEYNFVDSIKNMTTCHFYQVGLGVYRTFHIL